MDERHSLAAWRAAPEAARARAGDLARHPRFPQAARALAANMLALGEANKALDGVFKDAGRYMTAMCALHLHLSGGLTLPRLKEACGTSGFLSPGRARAMLHYLRHLGYFAPVGETPMRYVPTESFVSAWGAHQRAALEAARIVEPAVGWIADRLHEPAVFESFSRVQCRDLWQMAQGVNQENAFTRIFQHAYAGFQLIWTLIETSDGGVFPPHRSTPPSIAALARRFGVSRIHIRRMLDDAQRACILTCEPDGGIVFAESQYATLTYLYAMQLLQLLTAASGAMDALAGDVAA
jgi:hypothetical protein